MKSAAKRMAVCAMLTALSVIWMLLGAALELGMYACPLFSGLCFLPVGQKYGRRYHVTVFAASAILSFLLVPNWEENLIFAGFLGWYPIVRPGLQRLPKLLGWVCKLIIFNMAMLATQWLVMTVLVPEVLPDVLLWVLLALGNLTFLAYDHLVPKAAQLLGRLTAFL